MTVNAIILTGGRSRRFGGEHKPGVEVAGRSTISRILASIRGAAADAQVWVAGPADGLSGAEQKGVRVVREEPEFAGPLAGIAAAADAMPTEAAFQPETAFQAETADVTLVLAGDMPMVTAGHLGELISTCRATGRPAVGTDDRGRTQFLCAAWPTGLLRARLTEIGDPTDGAVKLLLTGLEPAVVSVAPEVVSDFDTAAELEAIRARLSPDGP
ncbi:MAG: NTP transferase domain-containing protein [Brevibacterium linens]|uniref:NTP transferase domain-containing protein n=1 Tax=Brevibacterium linens TaxID=1703 RepID=UPI000FCA2801|nr:NTP transferase domain-containing protein [Brevibacterium linens]AZU01902.1 molybdopterin-guanine dinucleotide biosynthesis protein A [Brevibacterium linens]